MVTAMEIKPREMVAPFTGAWIEIIVMSIVAALVLVAPFTGAWIEIWVHHSRRISFPVAPFTGAWIEMRWRSARQSGQYQSLPSRERGLKSDWCVCA